MNPPKVIKRYANRKLYDTERSCYVTLDEIAQMIKEGEDVQVLDNKSKEDLTSVTLAQIIVEEEKKSTRMPLKLLRGIIQSSNDALGDFYQKHFVDPVQQIKGDVEKRATALFRRDDRPSQTDTDAAPTSPGETAEKPGDEGAGTGPVRAFVASTTEAFDSWQRRIDEQVKDTVSKMTHITRVGPDVDALKTRIAALEERLKSLENGTREPGPDDS